MSIEQFPCPRCRRWIAKGAVSVLCLSILTEYEIAKACPGRHVCMAPETPILVDAPHIEISTGSLGLSNGYYHVFG